MSRDILFLSHRMPFPPDRGDKIRSHHVLKRIAGLAPVHVATFADDDRDIAEEVELAAVATSYRLVRRVKPMVVAGVESLLKHKPVSMPAFFSVEISNYVAQVLREHSVAAIYLFSSQMGQYIPADYKGRVIADFVDVDSAKFEAYGKKHGGLRGWVEAREGRLLRGEESALARRADTSLFVSKAEAALFRTRLSPEDSASCDVRAMPNGIDSRHFDPALVKPEPRLEAMRGPKLIFTGQMDYAPNIEATLRVVKSILPQLREEQPDISFHIVGRNPSVDLLEHDGVGGCHVWGSVDDMRPWLKGANLALIPLDIARGIQNKVLEAMAMELPVVLSASAAVGIDAEDGAHFAVAESDAEIVERVLALISHPRLGWTMGMAARRFVVEQMSWQAALASLPEMLGQSALTKRNAA